MTDAGRRVRGRLAPEGMYPAGVAGVRTRRVTLPSGITLRVAESGGAGAPPVVLLHGWGASLYMWRDWFAPLAEAGFRVLAVDLPGHGLSDKPVHGGAYTLERQAAVLRELLEAEGVADARVIAQSMAGTIALELALAAGPVIRRLALINPACFGRVRLQPVARLVSPALVEPVLGYVVPRWIVSCAHRLAYADRANVSAQNVEEYWAPSQDPAYARAMRRLLHEFRWRREPADRLAARLAVLHHPVLVLLGGRDTVVRDAAPYANALRRAGAPLEVVEIAEGGHAMNEEAPSLMIDRVLGFLR